MDIPQTCFYVTKDFASTLRYSLLFPLIPFFLHGMSDLLVIWWLVHTYKTVERSGVGIESQGTEVWGLLRISSSRNSSKSRALTFPRHHQTLLAFKCPLAQLFSSSVLIHIFKNWSNIALRSICWDASTHRSTLRLETTRNKIWMNMDGRWIDIWIWVCGHLEIEKDQWSWCES